MANGWSITTESVKNSAERVRDLVAQYETAVSYTHLTLPTKLEV